MKKMRFLSRVLVLAMFFSMATGMLIVNAAEQIAGGSSEKLSPTDTTNRAQMAQVLYNLLSK